MCLTAVGPDYLTERAKSMLTQQVAEITDAIAESAKGDKGGSFLIADGKLPGFFLKVGARDKSWIVRRKFHGTTRTLTIGTYPATRAKDAKPLARKYLSDLELGTHPKEKSREIRQKADERRAASHWTLGLAFDWYLAGQNEEAKTRLEKSGVGAEPCPRKEPLSDASVKSYVSGRLRIEKAGYSKTPVADLTADALMKMHAKIVEQANENPRARAGGKTSAAQTMRCARAVVRALIPIHLKATKDPFAEIPRGRKWSEPEPKNRTIIEEDGGLKRWWRAVEALREKTDGRAKDAGTIADWLQLTLLWGCRRAETQELTWDQVSFEHGIVSFDKTKSGRPHAVPFGPYARSILERRRDQAEKNGDDSPFIFPATRTGYKTKTRTHIRQTKKAEDEIAKASGVDFSAHDLRRTSASLLGEAGVGVYSLKAALNHSANGGDVTERHYMRIRLRALRAVFEKLEESILEEAGVRKKESSELELLIELLKEKLRGPTHKADALRAMLQN